MFLIEFVYESYAGSAWRIPVEPKDGALIRGAVDSADEED